MTPPAKPTLTANLAAQLGQVQSAPPTPSPAHITINVAPGASLTLVMGQPASGPPGIE